MIASRPISLICISVGKLVKLKPGSFRSFLTFDIEYFHNIYTHIYVCIELKLCLCKSRLNKYAYDSIDPFLD